MKKSYIILIVIAAVILCIFFWFKGTYNNMVNTRENVAAQWSNVENQYQRRLDLIPNLVSTVKGYAAHEENTLTEVINARAKATQMQISIDQLDETTLKKLNNVQSELSSALSRLMAISRPITVKWRTDIIRIWRGLMKHWRRLQRMWLC